MLRLVVFLIEAALLVLLQPPVPPIGVALIEAPPRLLVHLIEALLTEVPLLLPVLTTISPHSQHHSLLQSLPSMVTDQRQLMASSMA